MTLVDSTVVGWDNISSSRFYLYIVGLRLTSLALNRLLEVYWQSSVRKDIGGGRTTSSDRITSSDKTIRVATVLQGGSGVWLRAIDKHDSNYSNDMNLATNQALQQNSSIRNTLHLVCLSPLVEETLFRLIPYWLGVSPAVAMLIAGPVFGLAHLINYRVFNSQLSVTANNHTDNQTDDQTDDQTDKQSIDRLAVDKQTVSVMVAVNQAINANFIGLIYYLVLRRYQHSLIPIALHVTNNLMAWLSTLSSPTSS